MSKTHPEDLIDTVFGVMTRRKAEADQRKAEVRISERGGCVNSLRESEFLAEALANPKAVLVPHEPAA